MLANLLEFLIQQLFQNASIGGELTDSVGQFIGRHSVFVELEAE
jgi:hypothetical protein